MILKRMILKSMILAPPASGAAIPGGLRKGRRSRGRP